MEGKCPIHLGETEVSPPSLRTCRSFPLPKTVGTEEAAEFVCKIMQCVSGVAGRLVICKDAFREG